jgi:proline dehydrogenase
VAVPPSSPVRRLLDRFPHTRSALACSVEDAARVAAEVVGSGRLVALEHRSIGPDDDESALASLTALVHAAGLAGACELTVPVDRVGAAAARRLAAGAADAGLAVALAGPAGAVDPLLAALPAAGVVVPAREPDAEQRCRAAAARRVRLGEGRGATAALAFVRCLNVLMSGPGTPEVATTDPRLVAIAGERAAWNERTPESWEHVMPYGVRSDEQQRLVAAGHRVRVTVPAGGLPPGVLAPGLLVRRLAGRP